MKSSQSNSLNSEHVAVSQDKKNVPHWRDYLLWISLAATASILLLATTSHITQEIAVIPFLWVLPLTIYILSFILAFSGERWYSRRLYLGLFFLATLFVAWALVGSNGSGKINISDQHFFVGTVSSMYDMSRRVIPAAPTPLTPDPILPIGFCGRSIGRNIYHIHSPDLIQRVLGVAPWLCYLLASNYHNHKEPG